MMVDYQKSELPLNRNRIQLLTVVITLPLTLSVPAQDSKKYCSISVLFGKTIIRQNFE